MHALCRKGAAVAIPGDGHDLLVFEKRVPLGLRYVFMTSVRVDDYADFERQRRFPFDELQD